FVSSSDPPPANKWVSICPEEHVGASANAALYSIACARVLRKRNRSKIRDRPTENWRAAIQNRGMNRRTSGNGTPPVNRREIGGSLALWCTARPPQCCDQHHVCSRKSSHRLPYPPSYDLPR